MIIYDFGCDRLFSHGDSHICFRPETNSPPYYSTKVLTEGIEPSISAMSKQRVRRYTTRALEVRTGFEPVNESFADSCVKPDFTTVPNYRILLSPKISRGNYTGDCRNWPIANCPYSLITC